MDRLSNYATKDAETEEDQERLKKELNAAQAFLERLSLNEVRKTAQGQKGLDYAAAMPENDGAPAEDGDKDKTEEADADKKEGDAEPESKPAEEPEPDVDYGDDIKGIPKNIKLFEIFYEQVVNLVNAQHLAIQDTTALLVSLANLAL